MIVAPFLRPENGVGDTPPLPYYLYDPLSFECSAPLVDHSLARYCLVGIAVIASGIIYWTCWRVVPKWFGYKFVPRKETLGDGTVVAVVRLLAHVRLSTRVQES